MQAYQKLYETDCICENNSIPWRDVEAEHFSGHSHEVA